VKIYVAAVEALREKERQGETQEPSKLIQPNSGYWRCLFLTLRISLIYIYIYRALCFALPLPPSQRLNNFITMSPHDDKKKEARFFI
jgi:hypothetical protein